MAGFTKSYRTKWTHPVFRNLLEAGIWAWMCDTAAWKPCSIRFGDSLFKLERGQLVTSVRFISQGFEIGQQVTRTFLENLEKEGMVNTLTTHRGTILTICNYDKYQDNEKQDNTHPNKQPTNSQQTANTNKKEGKKVNEGKKEIYYSDFERFWKIYPKARAGSKEKAFIAFVKALDRAPIEKLMKSVKFYSESDEVKKGFAKGCAAWLNDDRFNNECWENESKGAKPKGFDFM